MESKVVCIVDDSADQIFLLKHFLKRVFPEYEAKFFDSGILLMQYLSMLSQKEDSPVIPYVIILDLNMPDLDGQEILTLIMYSEDPQNDWWKQIPVVLNSSMASDDIIQSCYDAGTVAFLTKSGDFYGIKGLLQSNWLRQMQR